jgi:hypothetical protein
MSLDEEIAFWTKAMEEARTKELALVCFGIRAGLQMARRAREPKL